MSNAMQFKARIKNLALKNHRAKKKQKVGPEGIEPSTKRLCIPLQLSLPLSGLWAGLSLRPIGAPAV